MISRLVGKLIESSPQSLTLDVNGVGYSVLASLTTYQRLPKPGESVTLFIYTHVREDEIVLFGFLEQREKQLFQKLIKVNGVGPRLALNILSGISTDDLVRALRTEDLIRITAIPGIGKKTAERIIIDLKDKLLDLQGPTSVAEDDSSQQGRFHEDLLSVLTNLGYKRTVAERALRNTPLSDVTDLQDAVRLTLRHLGDAPLRKLNS